MTGQRTHLFALVAHIIVMAANLVVIAVERYLKIVHSIWHKNHFSPWMIHAAIIFTWIDGIALNVPLLVPTTDVANGKCMSVAYWPNEQAAYIYGIWYFIYFFVIPVLLFVYCYGRIVAVVRRQAKVKNTGNSGMTGPATGNMSPASYRAQINVIKTMLTVTILFIVCWLPNVIYYLLTVVIFIWDLEIYYITISIWNVHIYYITIFIAFLNICLNPFVYAGQHDAIKTRIREMLQVARRLIRGEHIGTDDTHQR